ncbi:MAG: L-histidine N(alpha)-methyltransferase [Streptosporangiales bacterium]|nr:L-histidine N(alpha)-methyltransferase [Streptosporangiales bacterium]
MERHLTDADLARDLRADVSHGLRAQPKTLPPKWFYDARGAALFEDITRTEEYYPTRAERAILSDQAPAIAAASGADTLLELGAGSAEKTRLLLDALGEAGTLRRYIPVDVSGEALTETVARTGREYPGVEIHGVIADFEQHLRLLPNGGRRLIAFLGSTIGNLRPPDRIAFLRTVRKDMTDGDALLLGTDLVKDRARLLAAYDDAGGVTAEFNRNVLHVINREIGSNFAPERFQHVVMWDDANEWVEMRLRSSQDQRIRLASLDLTVEFAEGEDLHTEISAKFRREGVESDLCDAGLTLRRWWTDPSGDFALSLAVAD